MPTRQRRWSRAVNTKATQPHAVAKSSLELSDERVRRYGSSCLARCRSGRGGGGQPRKLEEVAAEGEAAKAAAAAAREAAATAAAAGEAGSAAVGLQRMRAGACCCCVGVANDCRRRLPHCFSDCYVGLRCFRPCCCGGAAVWTLKTASAALFMFFATFFSTVALGVHVHKATKGRIGIAEYLLGNSLVGMAHAALGCQPLLVLRPTGPITAIVTKLSELADAFHVDFYALLALTGMFVGLYLGLAASLEASRFIGLLTRFTHEIFCFFVCSIYIVDGISDVLGRFSDSTETQFAESFFASTIALITLVFALILSRATHWKSLSHGVRSFFTDNAVTLAVAVAIGVSYAFPIVPVRRISLPQTGAIRPTAEERANEGWFVLPRLYQHLFASPNGFTLTVLAALAAVPISFFFFVDQNVSSLLTQQSSMKLTKGSYYHASLAWIASFNIIAPLFGLPFITGSLPHSPQLVHALTVHGDARSNYAVVRVEENRIAPFLMYLLIGMPLLAPVLISVIPEGAIDGILVFVGIAGLFGCELWDRLNCLFSHRVHFPAKYKATAAAARAVNEKQRRSAAAEEEEGSALSPAAAAAFGGRRPKAPPPTSQLFEGPRGLVRFHGFTLLQVGALALCWAVNVSPIGLCAVIVLCACVPFRRFVLPCCYGAEELAALDGDDEDAEEEEEKVGGEVAAATDDDAPIRTLAALREGTPPGIVEVQLSDF